MHILQISTSQPLEKKKKKIQISIQILFWRKKKTNFKCSFSHSYTFITIERIVPKAKEPIPSLFFSTVFFSFKTDFVTIKFFFFFNVGVRASLHVFWLRCRLELRLRLRLIKKAGPRCLIIFNHTFYLTWPHQKLRLDLSFGKASNTCFSLHANTFHGHFFLVKKLSLPEIKLCSLPLCYWSGRDWWRLTKIDARDSVPSCSPLSLLLSNKRF